MNPYILIIGAKSDIGIELSKIYAKHGYNLYLAARDINSFTAVPLEESIDIILKEFDITSFDTHKSFFDSLEPKPLGVIVVSGYMAEQKECENSFEKTLNTINVNFTGAVSILNLASNYMEKEKRGFIIGVSSVAGDRGRGTNYIYGSSKAAFSTYLSGLRNRLHKSQVQVLTVKPGFVYTKMTQHLSLPKSLTSTASLVAKDIYIAQQNKKDILYTKTIWKLIMFFIKIIPESIFKRRNI